jgi:hypothetical protein
MPAARVELPAFSLRFNRPIGIEDESWMAITATVERLGRAISADDLSQAVGIAKELVESVAKSVLVVRGEVVAENAAFTAVVARAHDALKRQPGKGLTQAEPLRSVIQNAKSMASNLAELRNSFGTGHGRALEPDVSEELSQLCVDAAWMWSRWALRRLHALAQGLPDPLIKDLINGGIFTSGLLTERLLNADLARQEPEVQRRIGVAVGQRAMGETFVIREDGIEECAKRDDPEIWPAAYREGAFEGLFVNPYGQLTVDWWSVQWASRVVAPLRHPRDVIEKLAVKVDELPQAEAPPYRVSRDKLLEDLRDGARFLPEEAHAAWLNLADRLDGVLR